MATGPDQSTAIEAFVTRWEASGAAERANYALFLAELCGALGVPIFLAPPRRLAALMATTRRLRD